VLCKRRGNLYFAEGLFEHYGPIMLRGDYAFVSVWLQSQVSFELRLDGVCRNFSLGMRSVVA
jgi:hypothetical protein